MTMWAPADYNALTRLLASFVKRPAEKLPQILRLLVPIPLLPGMDSVSKLFDLWSHPLLGEKWACICGAPVFATTPMEMILPGRQGPRHVQQGLAIFSLMANPIRAEPRIVFPMRPLLTVAAPGSFFADLPTNLWRSVLRGVHSVNARLAAGQPSPSPGSTQSQARMVVEFFFDGDISAMEQMLLMRQVRRSIASQHVFLANSTLYADADAKIVECNSPTSFFKVWPLCSQALFLSGGKMLIATEAEEGSWRPALDRLMQEEPEAAITRIRWKPSRHGGRPWLTPSATPTQLGASRRQKGASKDENVNRFFTDIQLGKDVGPEDAPVMRQLLTHLGASTPVVLQESPPSRAPRQGEWTHLRSRDASAAPGRARLYLASQDEVDRVYQALHGQIIQIGADRIFISVTNDATDMQRPGNGRRAAGAANRSP